MDDDVRTTERAWRASGAVEDHARHLVALVRAARLPFPRLRLAARLAHPAAGIASGIVALDGRPIPPVRVDTAARAVRQAEREVRLRLVDLLHDAEPLAAAVAGLGLLAHAPPDGPLAAAAVAAVRRAIAGDPAGLAAARDRLQAAIEADMQRGALLEQPALHAQAAVELALAAGAAGAAWAGERLPGAVLRLLTGLSRHGPGPPAARWESARAALLAWALGGAA